METNNTVELKKELKNELYVKLNSCSEKAYVTIPFDLVIYDKDYKDKSYAALLYAYIQIKKDVFLSNNVSQFSILNFIKWVYHKDINMFRIVDKVKSSMQYLIENGYIKLYKDTDKLVTSETYLVKITSIKEMLDSDDYKKMLTQKICNAFNFNDNETLNENEVSKLFQSYTKIYIDELLKILFCGKNQLILDKFNKIKPHLLFNTFVYIRSAIIFRDMNPVPKGFNQNSVDYYEYMRNLYPEAFIQTQTSIGKFLNLGYILLSKNISVLNEIGLIVSGVIRHKNKSKYYIVSSIYINAYKRKNGFLLNTQDYVDKELRSCVNRYYKTSNIYKYEKKLDSKKLDSFFEYYIKQLDNWGWSAVEQ